MTDIEKEFLKAIHESTMDKYAAAACYEIYKRELDRIKNAISWYYDHGTFPSKEELEEIYKSDI